MTIQFQFMTALCAVYVRFLLGFVSVHLQILFWTSGKSLFPSVPFDVAQDRFKRDHSKLVLYDPVWPCFHLLVFFALHRCADLVLCLVSVHWELGYWKSVCREYVWQGIWMLPPAEMLLRDTRATSRQMRGIHKIHLCCTPSTWISKQR